ncbi:D-alanyl-D-alanine carboxypeptidase/D-alanyl-D-alanine-endopeptidase [Arthrobacter sp. CJ23]|uniref:D-alanyl-D-alanine carboxypeptidase/D-alanyl-D-alanine endopeptidase n=1 Tax=Arthrobacter sp. CJ23 TaxID=2972479 RepID=UPI00215D1E61|nr:D-alanyl-D-alanine carboxypeptidase/D-alanyl-D-alanine-endopeptidase [Arthrobacter sp. CJ23]UVJ39718.1 D-alanyl-D-alanine carboxypeptidase/D-alanyl-D-alanine-endopeptidase [Arthrobacter sp. CJ23]
MNGVKDAGARKRVSVAWGRWFTPVMLILVLLVLMISTGLGLVPGLFAGPAAPAPGVPAWQLPPTQLSRPDAVAPLGADAPLPVPAELARLLNGSLKPDGAGTFTGVVQDASTGQVLFDRDGDANRIPASNMKLLTAVATLRAVGPETRFSTRVLAGDAPGSVVLTGGGDVLLGAGEPQPGAVMGHAGLAALARDTVAALAERGISGTVTVRVDDSLFEGPGLNPAWAPGDVDAGETAPLFPLALNAARSSPNNTTGPRPKDAAATAAETFAAQLSMAGAASGLTLAPGVERAKGDPAQVLATAESATVSQQVDLMLETSDNYLAEALGRMAAVKSGLPGSNDGATAAVRQQLEELGIAAGSMRLADVSGLALENQVSARQFAEVVRAITNGPELRLRAALDGFPVAGLTGTLDQRYGEASTAGGAGLVRAKTGTLNTVIALSGYVVDADGRLLVFSFIGNGLEPGAAGNKVALDRSASVLAACGCR